MEDEDKSEYFDFFQGENVQPSTTRATDGSVSFEWVTGDGTIYSNSGLPNYPSRGETFRHDYYQATDGAASFLYFGGDDPQNGYGLLVDNDGALELRKDTRGAGGSLTTLDTASISPPTGEWLVVEVVWGSPTITGRVEDQNDNILASVSADDLTFDSGGIGWGGNQGHFVDFARIA